MAAFLSFTARKGVHRFCLLCCIFFSACAGIHKTDESVTVPAPLRPGTVIANPEAVKLFSGARALWRGPVASVKASYISTDPEKAASLLDKALSLEPAYAEAYAWRGLARSELGLREEAFDDLTRAIRLDPQPEIYAFRALASIRAGQTQAARRDLDYALKLSPSCTTAYNFFGLLALKENEASEACLSFNKSCSNGDCSFLEAARTEKICP